MDVDVPVSVILEPEPQASEAPEVEMPLATRFNDFLQETADNIPVDPNPNSHIDNLSLDVLLDDILPYLQVEDIRNLHRVSRRISRLIHQPVIWKRFVQEVNVLLPPTRPTLSFSSKSMGYEFEQLVARAISLEDNWRKPNPDVVSVTTFNSQYELLELKLLPGGKFLVASVMKAKKYYILVYHLDHPKGPHILARLDIPARGYHLQAKYMMYGDNAQDKDGKEIPKVPVIMIAYALNTDLTGGPTNEPPSMFDGNKPIRPSSPLHEVVCVRMDLRPVEQVAAAHRDPNNVDCVQYKLWESRNGRKPFIQTLVMPLKQAVDSILLFERSGKPWVCVHQARDAPLLQGEAKPDNYRSEDYIIFADLVTKKLSSLICQPNAGTQELPQGWIWRTEARAIHPLPKQNQILLFRTISVKHLSTGRCADMHFAELFDMLPENSIATTMSGPASSCHIADKKYSKVQISDYDMPSNHGEGYRLQSDSHPIPPISIFLTKEDPVGIEHHILWPKVKEDKPGEYIYSLDQVIVQTNYQTKGYRPHFLPGAFRAILYTTPENDVSDAPPLLTLKRYINPEFQLSSYLIKRVNRSSDAERRELRKMPINVYSFVKIPQDIKEKYKNDGLVAMAWDENIGRVCMVSGAARGTVDVLDFAHTGQLHNEFEEGFFEDDISQEGVVEKGRQRIAELDLYEGKDARPRDDNGYDSDSSMLDGDTL
ncbi:hypothetical protein H0H87_000293 [Tephrocybe sp. NHM501043]|nr:hypothetical protein H0H87_000293 [Tephrocybe sp. NHM501043]